MEGNQDIPLSGVIEQSPQVSGPPNAGQPEDAEYVRTGGFPVIPRPEWLEADVRRIAGE